MDKAKVTPKPSDEKLEGHHPCQMRYPESAASQYGSNGSQQQTQRKKLAGIASVGKTAGKKFRQTIGDTITGSGKSQFRLVESQCLQIYFLMASLRALIKNLNK
jgi:hypothetical protein